LSALEFDARVEAHEPPEIRGSGRDDVALLVASLHDCRLTHARFGELPDFLDAGDLIVVNTSATLPAALDARLGDRRVELRLSTPAAGHSGQVRGTVPGTRPEWTRRPEAWIVELRTAEGRNRPGPPPTGERPPDSPKR